MSGVGVGGGLSGAHGDPGPEPLPGPPRTCGRGQHPPDRLPCCPVPPGCRAFEPPASAGSHPLPRDGITGAAPGARPWEGTPPRARCPRAAATEFGELGSVVPLSTGT